MEPPSPAVPTHLGCQFPEPFLSQVGLLWGPSSGVPARSWSLPSSWSVAHLSLDFMLSCWESREMMSEGELTTPESSVVSSDAKQLLTDTVSSASHSTGGTLSMPQGLLGPRGRLTGQDTARTGQPACFYTSLPDSPGSWDSGRQESSKTRSNAMAPSRNILTRREL